MMKDFIFENATKVFFGKGCVKEYLSCLIKEYGDTVMLAKEDNVGLILGVGGGSVMDCCKAVSIAARYQGDV